MPVTGIVLVYDRRFIIVVVTRQASGQQWGEADLARMKALSDIGLELSITGGITPADLPLFKEIRVKAFIAGRSLAGAANPAQVAADFHAQIDSIWGGKRA